ncbi:aminotransferase class I/II-fold pyridoxal phosphate-dependent enzyme [candidate division KSB1 bacterium]|nr:aminotransferase class I/II-fold pyridoxal phosphate-dependent enzyme [candidate division KSB1 bacterium]RQW05196.1 MAG: aminotransferase class I/II-fold pyridoxal phosphate-dependent enzyme [candidate division KSB1 bacterium]
MDLDFGQRVAQTAQEMISQGKDVNQTAKILFDRDQDGFNYGIGIILDGSGAPMSSSFTLTQYATAEVQSSGTGTYYNSAKLMHQLKTAVLRWQRIPETYWDSFKLALPSDAGTGAVKSAVELELLLNPGYKKIGIEELGWPAHKAIAKLARVDIKEFPQDAVMPADMLALYQSGPMNTTGMVRGKEVIRARATAAAASGNHVVLDRAYSGFEFARLAGSESYDSIMRKSYELQLKAFLEAGVPMSIAISPTKAFLTFAFRPCGFLLVYNPEPAKDKEVIAALNATIRARGSSFEHPITRAFVKAMIHDLPALEQEQMQAFVRLFEAEKMWHQLTDGTAIADIFSENYAGLFRNPRAKTDAPAAVYGSHLYPVFSQGRCRLNATGLPVDEALASQHVKVFAEYCLGG